MPDISMCEGTDCPMRDQCRRHTAKPNGERQAWFMVPPVNGQGECSEFWDNGTERRAN